MSLFDRFKRKPKVVLPEEVNAYYQAEKRERIGVAIVLAIIALISTVLVIGGLFFGGRYVYRQFFDDKQTEQTQVGNGDNKDTNNPRPNGDQEVTPNQNDGSDTNGSSQNNSNNGSTPQPQSGSGTVESPSQAIPPLGDESLPRTGDEGM